MADRNNDGTDLRLDGVGYEMAGRDASNTFNDMCSASKARHRQDAVLARWYTLKNRHPNMPPGLSSVLHINVHLRAAPEDGDIKPMSKRDLWKKAQVSARPMRHKKGTKRCGGCKQCKKRKDKYYQTYEFSDLQQDSEDLEDDGVLYEELRYDDETPECFEPQARSSGDTDWYTTGNGANVHGNISDSDTDSEWSVVYCGSQSDCSDWEVV